MRYFELYSYVKHLRFDFDLSIFRTEDSNHVHTHVRACTLQMHIDSMNIQFEMK